MIAIQSATYTSLKDLLPPPSILSPSAHNSSWQEVPIKNPLVKHAALAYLQPMSTPLEVGDQGFFRRLKDQFFGQCGCLGWFRDVVWKPLRNSLWETREEIEDEDEDEKLD
uniref:Uncharacterized protein LOC105638508 n=1 Tax=Rhizophora mucronata TaxID=61149 RepID=A0A2P2QX33_RHIMU